MNATEMMLGDLVMVSGKPMHVTFAMMQAGIEVKPMPLTPEILEKNGMSRNPFGEYFAEDKHCFLEISREPEGFFWTVNANEYSIIPLNYVHELQHALRLCGIEKEVVV